MLQAWWGTSRSAALGRGVPSEAWTDGGVRSSTESGAGRVPACVHEHCMVPGVEVVNFHLEARTNKKYENDWMLSRGRIAGYPCGPGGWQRPHQLRGGSSGGEAQVLCQQPASDGIPILERAGNCGESSEMASIGKTPKSAASAVPN